MKAIMLRVLKALFKTPRASDRAIADRVGVSQPTVTRTRHKLIDAKTVTFAAIPDFTQLDHKILAFTTIHEADEYMEMREELLKENCVLFLAKVADELFAVTAHKDIEDLRLFEAKYPATNSITLVTTLIHCLQPLDFTKLLNGHPHAGGNVGKHS